jgi:hypothetical protein
LLDTRTVLAGPQTIDSFWSVNEKQWLKKVLKKVTGKLTG